MCGKLGRQRVQQVDGAGSAGRRAVGVQGQVLRSIATTHDPSTHGERGIVHLGGQWRCECHPFLWPTANTVA